MKEEAENGLGVGGERGDGGGWEGMGGGGSGPRKDFATLGTGLNPWRSLQNSGTLQTNTPVVPEPQHDQNDLELLQVRFWLSLFTGPECDDNGSARRAFA